MSSRSSRTAARAGVLLAAVGAAALLTSGVASAHVTARVLGEAAAKGGYTKITYRVPNEDAAASTIKVEVKLPAEYPLTSVRTKPMAGWTSELTKIKLPQPVKSGNTEITEAFSTVTWTAVSPAKIAPGQFEEFELSVGKLPDNTDTLVTPAIQTYDSGKVVAWDAPPPAEGAEEPEHPAPALALSAAQAGEHGASGEHAEHSGDTTEASAAGRADNTARWLGGAGLVVGALGLGLAAGATLRARKAIAAAKAGE
ncbi:Conserved membrane protein in copper uptake, YcnI [Actinokineospora spheciospongiae]|uniref:Conserved membrane protein in copper uptake, YcnI n=1 Tax=Actinokineospora spheciospongiae TaxID=909613 RepID=W7IP40_9PSEU|nr:YcnI family protein [Actinokineospora spheciospongiae]EWC58331.1 Conserved membrane protein in copper uptake, YcnI [Actinokineospora spheciospongiae]